VETFLHSALDEAQNLISTTIPQTFKVDKKLRSSSPSAAKVLLSTRTLDQDYWVCRQSVHADAAEPGTATWSEFEHGLRENHSENEMDYTPSVASVEHLLEWPTQKEIEGGWTDIHMHGKDESIPPPPGQGIDYSIEICIDPKFCCSEHDHPHLQTGRARLASQLHLPRNLRLPSSDLVS
jgi:hypothetical protein